MILQVKAEKSLRQTRRFYLLFRLVAGVFSSFEPLAYRSMYASSIVRAKRGDFLMKILFLLTLGWVNAHFITRGLHAGWPSSVIALNAVGLIVCCVAAVTPPGSSGEGGGSSGS
jgi:hypothetical protein